MAGDLVSNMYEEIVYRGLMLCAFYGVAAGTPFPLVGKIDRAGLVLGGIVRASSSQWDTSNTPLPCGWSSEWSPQYSPMHGCATFALASISRTLGDVIVDSILKL